MLVKTVHVLQSFMVMHSHDSYFGTRSGLSNKDSRAQRALLLAGVPLLGVTGNLTVCDQDTRHRDITTRHFAVGPSPVREKHCRGLTGGKTWDTAGAAVRHSSTIEQTTARPARRRQTEDGSLTTAMPSKNHKDQVSETESKQPSNSRASQKARNAAAQAAQQELLAKHINSNGPQDKPKVEPLDFEAFSDDELVAYNRKYGLGYSDPLSINGNILNSEIGKKTNFSRNGVNKNRISKPELASHLKKHFMAMPCRENEIITSFLYKVKNQDKKFKLSF